MVTSTERPASKVDLERIAEFNRTDRPFPEDATIHQLIQAQVARHRDSVAVICDHDPLLGVSFLTYGQLNSKANQLAQLLRAKGAGPDRVVAIMVERSFSMIIGILGILKAGAAYLPIPTDNPAERTEYMLRDADVSLLLSQRRLARPHKFKGEIIDLDNAESFTNTTEPLPHVNQPTDLAYVIYTSGSTGRPKGVMIEHRSVVNRLCWMQNAYPITKRDVILQKTPYYFDVSVWELFWWAMSGAKLCFLKPGAEALPAAIVETVQRHRVSIMHFVPSMLNVFLQSLEAKDSRVLNGLVSVRHVFASGESLTPAHVKQFNRVIGDKIGARLTNLYGPTETTVDVSYFDCPKTDIPTVIPIGRPIDNTRFYVIRDTQQVPLGDIGELCVAGVGLARGYLHNPELTESKFVSGLPGVGERVYRTGDMVRQLRDGNLIYLGRADHQVKIRGLRIELGEIEARVREFPTVRDCVVTVRQYSDSVVLLVAYLVAREAFEIGRLKDFLKGHLPNYMVPNHFQLIERVPLGPTGKADRTALPEPRIQTRHSAP